MDRKSRNTIIVSIIGLAIVLITITYAYFAANITGIESASTISLNAGIMNINFEEGNELVTASNMYPRDEAWITKTFTLTGTNTTNQVMDYEVGLNIISNTFKGGQLSFGLEVGQNNDGASMSAVTNKAIVKSSGVMLIGKGSFQGPITNGTQAYTLKIYFKDNGQNQNFNQGATFSARIIVGQGLIDNYLAVNRRAVPANPCTDTEHTIPDSGDEYVNGQYTYHYLEEGGAQNGNINTTNRWVPINDSNVSGWGVMLSDRTSSSPVTSQLCTSINGEPVISMAYMFAKSPATSIDLSSFDTSYVIRMTNMFYKTSATSLDFSSFDTSNVTDMSYMFYQSPATSLDLSTFDTSNVNSMRNMFDGSAATSIDLSSFDTSKVVNMSQMFRYSPVSSIDLSSFDTSNVRNMDGMFMGVTLTNLDLSNFNTSSAQTMIGMFIESQITNLNLSTFDTSHVTNMRSMFYRTTTPVLDLSSFDTSNVTNMGGMFMESYHLTTIYVSDNFVTSSLNADSGDYTNPQGSLYMFYGTLAIVGGAGTTYDDNNTNRSYAHIDGGQSNPGYFTDIADKPSS